MKKRIHLLVLILGLLSTLPFGLHAQDVGLTIISPQTGTCASSNMQVMVQIINYNGANSVSNFPLAVSVSGSGSYSAVDTFVNTIKPHDTAYFTFTTTINDRPGGTYKVTSYSELSGDTDRTNDTSKTSVTISASPTPPTTFGAGRCGFGKVTLTAKSNASGAGNSEYWFADTTSGVALGSGDTFVTSYLNTTTTFYATTSAPQVDTANTTKASGRVNNGNMFNVIATSNFRIDSFGISPYDNTKELVEVYYKVGSYAGFQLKSSAWTKLGSQYITGKGTFTIVPIGGLNVVKGKTYGIYISRTGNSTLGLNYNQDTFNLKKPDMIIQSGCSLGGTFSSFVNERGWDGQIYYSKPGCGSEFVPTVATIKTGVNGVSLKKDSAFSGQFNSGAYNDPDAVCQGFHSYYDITPPKGLYNSDYGTSWTIVFDTLRTQGGKIFKDTALIPATSTSDALLEMFPDSVISNDILILKGTAKNLVTGCDSSFLRYIYFAPKPYPAFSVSNSCQGAATTFTNSTKIKTGSLTYLWNFGDGTTSKDANPVHVYKISGNLHVKLTAYTADGCSDTAVTTLTVNPAVNLKPIIVGGCPNLTTLFIDSSTLASGTYSVIWDFGDSTATTTSDNTTHTYLHTGTHTVKFFTTTNAGCNDTSIQTLNVVPGPVSHFTTNNTCEGIATGFANKSTIAGGGKIQSSLWRFGDGSTSTATSPTHLYASPGTYNVTLLSTSATGCTDSVTNAVTIGDHPTAAYTYVGGCVKRAIQFTDSSYIADNTSFTYIWNFGDLGTSNIATPSHTFQFTGTYKVKLKIISQAGCLDSVTKNITVVLPPTAGFSTSDECLGNPTSFSNSSTPAGLTYSWNFGDGGSSTLSDPTHTYAAVDSYKVVLTAFEGTCSNTYSETVNVLPDANAGFTSVDNKQNVTFTAKSGTQTSYLWSFGDGDTSSSVNPVHTYKNPGTYAVTLATVNSSGCAATTTDSVKVTFTGINAPSAQDISLQVYPNPFKNTTAINYNLKNAAQVKVEVYDMTGRQVAMLANEKQASGEHTFMFDAEKYNAGTGVYLLKVSIDNSLVNQEIIRIK